MALWHYIPNSKGDIQLSRVLIVDDDEFMRSMIRRRLFRSNPNAPLVFAASVSEAANIIEVHDDLRALLTDFDLHPGTGNDVARHFKEKFPEANVLGMSGNPYHEFDPNIFNHVLRKPFGSEDLRVLDSLCS